MPSRGSALAVAVASTTFSPSRTTAAPWACLANFPVSNEMCLPPASSTVTLLASGFMIHSFCGVGHPRRLSETTKRRAMRATIFGTRSHTLPSVADCHGERRRTALKDARVEDSSMLTRLQGFDGVFRNIPGDPAEKLTYGSGRFPSLDKMHAGMGHPGKWLLADA